MDDVFSAALAADVPVLMWGPPGVGKTARVQAAARDAGAHLETLVGSTLDPTDVSGLPVPDGRGGMDYAAPAWARRVRAALDEKRPAWLFLDELTTASAAVRAALLRVVHERRLPAVSIEGCRIIAAANGAEHAADGGVLDPATANRFAHVACGADPDVHLPGLLTGWGRGDAPEARAALVGFLRARPAALLAPPSGDVDGAERSAWPSPRSWDALARAAGTLERLTALAAALVGPPTAAELAAYVSALDLPDVEELLAGRAKLPSRGDRVLAALEGMVAAALAPRKDRDARVSAAWRVIGTARPDAALTAGRTLLQNAPDVNAPEAVALGARLLAART